MRKMMNETGFVKVHTVAFQHLYRQTNSHRIERKVILLDDLSKLFEKGRDVITDFVVLLFCKSGRLTLEMKGEPYVLETNDMLFCNKGCLFRHVRVEDQGTVTALCIYKEYVEKLFLNNSCQWTHILQVIHNPFLRLNTYEQELFQSYYQLITVKLGGSSHRSRNDLIDYVLLGFFQDLHEMINRYFLHIPEQPLVPSCRDEEMFKRFITLLKEHHGQEHFCRFYADRLCVSVKYMTLVVKRVSGRSVSEWIDIYLVDQIKVLLRTTNLSVAEISDTLNFSTHSFFGRYVKRMTGMSPLQLRRSLVERSRQS